MINQLFTESKSNEFTKNFLFKILLNQTDLEFYSVNEPDLIEIKTKKSHTRSLVLAKNKNSNYQKIINDSEKNVRGYCTDYYERYLIEIDQNLAYDDILKKHKIIKIVASQELRNKVLCPSHRYLEFENLNDLEYCVLESIGRSRYNRVYSTGENGLVQQFDLVPKQLHYILVNLESHGLVKKQVLTSEKKKSVVQLVKFACRIKSSCEKLVDYLLNKKDNQYEYSDLSSNIKKSLNISTKQFKTLIQSCERQSIVKRFFITVQVNLKKNKSSTKLYPKNRQVRMIKLTETYVKQYMSSKDDETCIEEDDQVECESSSLIGTVQQNNTSLYTQIFDLIDQFGKEGISLKQLGHLFGFDFYKSRRLGSNLQIHPDVVTMIKETNRGKAKYQTIFLRKYLSDPKHTQTPEQITILPQKNIQALVSNRMINRKQIIQDYLIKNKICTKYELTREIREHEEKLGLKGSIDSKTTKRMLLSLEKEGILKIFNASLKNTSYMCVRLASMSENDDLYVNYCATFKRTFDSVDVKSQEMAQSQPKEENKFKLTKKFIQSIVDKLEFSTNFSKKYALVPKFQKAIILHRFLGYLLFFYTGQQQSDTCQLIPSISEDELKNYNKLNESDLEMAQNCKLPDMSKLYTPLEPNNHLKWNSFIPPLKNTDKNCVFIGEIFSHMPLSIFCSLIVINHQVPGLVAILKHPQKRHMLVKDLPAELIAPLIFERRYLQRILAILQLMACLGLVTFVESIFKNNQAANRDVQSQLIYVHDKAQFYDTSTNRCESWTELNETNIKVLNNETFYDKFKFEFNSDHEVIDYWRKLLHVSMNTYKFNVSKCLHESRRCRQELLNKIVNRAKIQDVENLWPIDKYGDHMGPGLYDSQLFLNSFKNWVINQSNLTSLSLDNLAITKEADHSFAPYSELALFFPFGVFRGLASTSNSLQRAKKKPIKRKVLEVKKPEFKFKKPKLSIRVKNQNLIKTAKHLIDRAKQQSQKSIQSTPVPDHRATWSPSEDEMILMIKVAALYFAPNEKSVPFKLISDIMNRLMPKNCSDKRISSFGRRIKILMKSKMNCLFVSNKLELCKQDKKLEKKYANRRTKVKRNLVDKELVDLYVNFIMDMKEKLRQTSTNDVTIDLPDSIEKFHQKYRILNTQKDILFKDASSYFQQPKSDYEITFNTLHSAIHVC